MTFLPSNPIVEMSAYLGFLINMELAEKTEN